MKKAFVLLLVLIVPGAVSLAQDAKSDVKKAAEDTSNATKKAAHKTAHATKKAAANTCAKVLP